MNWNRYVILLTVCLGHTFFSMAQEEAQEKKWHQYPGLELTPQLCAALFNAEQKVSGTALGGELVYHHNTESNPISWLRILNLTSVDSPSITKT